MSLRSPLSERTKTGKVSGVAKRSAARAKPARDAAASVRTVKSGSKAKSRALMSPQEKKAARQEQRDMEQRIRLLTSIILRNNEAYKKRRIIWFALMALALMGTVVSIVTLQLFSPNQEWNISNPIGLISVVSIVVAYGSLIVVFIFDFMMIRPLRKAAEHTARGLSLKKAQALVEDYESRRLRKKRK